MNTSQGFSLAEVLAALFLMTGAALALLTHQWHMARLFNDLHVTNHAILEFDNIIERVYAGIAMPKVPPPFILKIRRSPSGVALYMNWPDLLSANHSDHCHYQKLVLMA